MTVSAAFPDVDLAAALSFVIGGLNSRAGRGSGENRAGNYADADSVEREDQADDRYEERGVAQARARLDHARTPVAVGASATSAGARPLESVIRQTLYAKAMWAAYIMGTLTALAVQ